MNIDDIRRLKLICLAKAYEPDSEFIYRRICRWYSKNFATPLREVENLPIEYVLQHYFEETFDTLATSNNDNDLQTLENIKRDLIGQTAEDIADEQWANQMLQEIKKDQHAKAENAENVNKNQKLGDLEALSTPNLYDEIEINRVFDDTPEGSQ